MHNYSGKIAGFIINTQPSNKITYIQQSQKLQLHTTTKPGVRIVDVGDTTLFTFLLQLRNLPTELINSIGQHLGFLCSKGHKIIVFAVELM